MYIHIFYRTQTLKRSADFAEFKMTLSFSLTVLYDLRIYKTRNLKYRECRCWFFGYKQFNYLAKSFGLISVLTKANGALAFKLIFILRQMKKQIPV